MRNAAKQLTRRSVSDVDSGAQAIAIDWESGVLTGTSDHRSALNN